MSARVLLAFVLLALAVGDVLHATGVSTVVALLPAFAAGVLTGVRLDRRRSR